MNMEAMNWFITIIEVMKWSIIVIPTAIVGVVMTCDLYNN